MRGNTYYTPTGATTQTESDPYQLQQYKADFPSFTAQTPDDSLVKAFGEAVKNRISHYQQHAPHEYRPDAPPPIYNQYARPAQRQTRFEGPNRADEEELRRQRSFAERLRQAQLNPPKKLMSGFNILPGYVDDTVNTPLPLRPQQANVSGFVGGPSPASLAPPGADLHRQYYEALLKQLQNGGEVRQPVGTQLGGSVR